MFSLAFCYISSWSMFINLYSLNIHLFSCWFVPRICGRLWIHNEGHARRWHKQLSQSHVCWHMKVRNYHSCDCRMKSMKCHCLGFHSNGAVSPKLWDPTQTSFITDSLIHSLDIMTLRGNWRMMAWNHSRRRLPDPHHWGDCVSLLWCHTD